MIKIYNRRTGEYEIENVAGKKMLEFLYGNHSGRMTLEVLIKRKLYSEIMGLACNTRLSRRMISGFIDKFNIDMSQCTDDIRNFRSFNHFFTRKLRAGTMKFSKEPEVLSSPGDGRLKAWADIDIKKLVQVKGFTYSLEELLSDKNLAEKYNKGICMVLRLAPIDYHRFHFLDDGACSKSVKAKGAYYSVNPVALENIENVFCKNKREYSIFHSKNFGDVIYVEVGATSVGSIVQTYIPDSIVHRGDEKGYFKFGGSTVILFFEKDAAKIDEEILRQTELGFETKVLVGEPIGAKGTINN